MTGRVFWQFRWVARANRSGDIHPQSHVRLGVFFAENLQNQPGAKVLNLPGKVESVINQLSSVLRWYILETKLTWFCGFDEC